MSEQPVTPVKNRRLTPRRRAKNSSRVTCIKGALGLGANLGVKLLDVSETGARLVVKEALNPGQEVELNLEAPGGGRPVRLPAEVIWSVPTADGQHCVGTSFHKRLSYADLQHLGQSSLV
jgi:hypothetical protein